MKNKLAVFGMFIVIITLSEIILRENYGFGDNVLVREDPDFEYIAQPNQEKKRFGKEIFFNEFSMRSAEYQSNSRTILGLGDSVLNGGSLIDQTELATSLLNDALNFQTKEELQVLNISYKGWGLDNAVAYLNKYGNFNAELIFLVVSSHDAYDNMDFTKLIGVDKNFPTEQYSFAIIEVFDAYLIPRLQELFYTKSTQAENYEVSEHHQNFNSGFQDILEISKTNNIPFLIYLHPEISEIKKGEYSAEGKLIKNFAQSNNVMLIEGIKGAKVEYYRDHIHLNHMGQHYLYKRLFPVLSDFISIDDSEQKLANLHVNE